MRLAITSLLALGLAGSAAATTLVNKDDTPFRYSVSAGGNKATGTIAPKSVLQNICPLTAPICVVVVEGVGEVEVTGADDVVIQNAKLSKE